MLDINEYNKLLYRQLDKEVKRKEMMTDYGRYLQHSKNTGSESNIELQAASWLANFRGLTTSNGFLKTPQGMKEICEGLIPQASKLLRKANKKGAPEETKAELRNARKFLEDCLADANAALQHSDEDPEHLEHGGKWRHHDYIDIKNGRYIYAKDKKSNNFSKNVQNAVDKHNNTLNTLKDVRSTSTDKNHIKALETLESIDKKNIANTIKAENLMRDVTKAEKEQKQQYQESHADAIAFNDKKKQARETAAKGEKREQVLSDITKSEPVQNYAKAIAKAYEEGLIRKKAGLAEFDVTNNDWRNDKRYDALLNAANASEDYCKKMAEESNGVTDWPDIRKELLENLLEPEIRKYINGQKAGNAAKAVEEDRKKKRWENQMQHSAMAATAMSRDEYEELLKKAESLT